VPDRFAAICPADPLNLIRVMPAKGRDSATRRPPYGPRPRRFASFAASEEVYE
jgi:hypothetical protein